MGIGNHTETISVGGRLMQRNVDKTGGSEVIIGGSASPVTLTAPSPVGTWVKSDANTATGTLTGGHGWGDGAHTCDVFWAGGMRYGVVITVSTNAIGLEGGTGTDFPGNSNTTVVAAIQQQVNVAIDGDLAAIVGVLATVPAHVDFQDASSDSICPLLLVANEPNMWDSSMSTTPYTGDPITKAMVTNGTLAWVTSTAYVVGDVRTNSGYFYKCLVAHTSGTFATDLAAGDWVLVTATFEVIALQDPTP
jgi:hypothetical protein